MEQLADDFKQHCDSLEEHTKAALSNIESKVERLEKVAMNTANEGVNKPKNATPAPAKTPSVPCPPPFSPNAPPPLPPRAPPMAPPRSANFTKRKSAFLSKPKALYIGDSVAHNAQFRSIEIATNCRIRTFKAYSSVHDRKARWPGKNFTDVTPAALMRSHQNDQFSQLILSAPTVDISNLDTSRMTPNDSTQELQQNIITSCKNIFAVAESSIRNHQQLKKIVILEHPPRFDLPDIDPVGLKPQLAKFANVTFGQLWLLSPFKDKIIVGVHNLNCSSDEQFAQSIEMKEHKNMTVSIYMEDMESWLTLVHLFKC